MAACLQVDACTPNFLIQEFVDPIGLGAGYLKNPFVVKDGYVDLVIDQQEWLQGYMAILQICISHVYGFGGLFINTGAGFVDKSNIDVIASLAAAQIR